MTRDKFIAIRKRLNKTQKEIALLLGVSLNTVESYEQGIRNIPGNVERILYFLYFKVNADKCNPGLTCWEEKQCPPDIRENCIAWLAKEGFFCWFMTGKTCMLETIRSPGKTANCFDCSFFLSNFEKIYSAS